MSDIPPTTPGATPTSAFPWRLTPYNNITPLTYRDGETLIEMYKGLRHWLFKELVPFVDDTFMQYVTEFNSALQKVDDAFTEVKAYVDDVSGSFDQKIADFNAAVTAANATLNNLLTQAQAAATAADAKASAAAGSATAAAASALAAAGAVEGVPTRADWESALDAVARTGAAAQDRLEYFPNAAAVSGMTGTRETIPTPDGSGNSVHPSVVFIPDGWNGWKYWMAMTPYPNSDDTFENPCLAVSQDGDTWSLYTGTPQPMDVLPGGSGGYNSDPDLVLHPNGTMYLFWRSYFRTGNVGTEERVYYRSSADGVNWTTKKLVFQSDETVRRLFSPSFIFENDAWTCYAVSGTSPNNTATPTTVVRMRSTNADPSSTWSNPQTVNVGTNQPGKQSWHIEVRKQNGKYIGLINDTNLGTTGQYGDLIFITSGDGLTFKRSPQGIIPRTKTGEHDWIYRATLIPAVENGIFGYRVWYSAKLSTAAAWYIYRTFVAESYPGGTRKALTGQVQLTDSLADQAGFNWDIVFPPGTFQVAPSIQLTVGSTRITAAESSVTKDGFNIRVDNRSGGTLTPGNGIVYWTAIGQDTTITVAPTAANLLVSAIGDKTGGAGPVRAALNTWLNETFVTSAAKRAGGRVATNSFAPGENQTYAVTFPAGLFANPPIVSITPGTTRLNVSFNSVTKDGMNVVITNWQASTQTAQPIGFMWTASDVA